MSGGTESSGGRLLWVTVLVALVVAIVAWCVVQPTKAYENLCEQGATLANAGLLDKAQETYAEAGEQGRNCKEEQEEAVEDAQKQSAKSFAEAQVLGEAELKWPAIYAYAAGLLLDPFDTEGRTGLSEEIAGLPELKLPGAAAAVSKEVATEKSAPTEKKAKAKGKGKGKKRTPAERAAARRQAAARKAAARKKAAEARKAAAKKAAEDKKAAAERAATLVQAGARCQLGTELITAGLLDDAAKAIAGGLAVGAEECLQASKTLGARTAEATGFLHAGQRLDAEGDADGARDQYVRALRANSDLDAARTELEESLEDESEFDWVGSKLAGIPGTLEDVLKWFVPLAVLLLVAALGLWIAIREWSAHSAWARGKFKDLGGHRGFGFFRKAAVPETKIEAFEKNGDTKADGKDFTTLLEAAIKGERGREPAFLFDRFSKGSEPAAATPLKDVLAEVPATKLLGTLIQVLSKLFRRRAIVLRGSLAASSKQGAGVVMIVEESGRDTDETVTLWEKSFDPKPGAAEAGSWLRLVPAAAAWSRWQLAAAYARPTIVDRGGWAADAMFRTALAWQAAEDFHRAEALYADALERDPLLLPAAHNLAVLEIRNGRYEQARRRIVSLREKLDAGEPSPRQRWPMLDTASLYTLALALAYPSTEEQTPATAAGVEKAVGKASELVKKLAAALKANGGVGEPTRRELAGTEGPSVVLLASLLVRSDRDLREEAAKWAAREYTAGKVDREDLTRADELTPWDLIDGYVLRKGRNVSRRTHYNLACYYATLTRNSGGRVKAACLKKAFAALDDALTGGGMVTWAETDPSLEPLRYADAERFAEILAAHAIEDDPKDADEEPEAEPDGGEDGKEGEDDE